MVDQKTIRKSTVWGKVFTLGLLAVYSFSITLKLSNKIMIF